MARGWDRLKSWCYYLRYPLLMGLAIIADRLFILWPYFDAPNRSLAFKLASSEALYETLWWLFHIAGTLMTLGLFVCVVMGIIILPLSAFQAYRNYSEKKPWRAKIVQDVQGQTASIINGVINEELAKVREIAKQMWGEIRIAKAEVEEGKADLRAREMAFNMTCQKLGLQLAEFEPEPELKVDPEPPANLLPAVESAPASDNQGEEAAANLECPVNPADLPQDDQASLPAANMPTDGQVALPESENHVAGHQEPEALAAQPKPQSHDIKTVTEDSPIGGVLVRLGHGGNGRYHEGILVAPSRGGDEEELDEEDEESDSGSNMNFDNDPIIQAVVLFMEGQDQWEGMATELAPLLVKIEPQIEKTKASAVAKKIYRAAAYLMTYGIACDKDRSNKKRSIVLKRLNAQIGSRK